MKLFGPRYPEEIAKRIPPGQRLVKTWPVLHFGPIPDFDESTWNLEVNGLVDNPYSLTYAELKALGPVDVQADMHCVTGWSTLDNTWTGVPFRVLAEKAGRAGRRQVGDRALRLRLYVGPLAPGDAGRRRAGRVGPRRRAAHRRARLPAPPGRPEALRLEEREVAPGLEFSAQNKRGFWEVRGYHIHAEPWAEERYSYQEGPRAELEP